MKKAIKQHHPSVNGFSLLEVLIVMAIVGILTATTLPKFTGLVTKTKESSVQTIAHSLELALESYRSIYQTLPDVQSIDALFEVLNTNGILTTDIKNPFTQSSFTDNDKDGKIEVESSSSTNQYTIKAYSKGNVSVLVELISN